MIKYINNAENFIKSFFNITIVKGIKFLFIVKN